MSCFNMVGTSIVRAGRSCSTRDIHSRGSNWRIITKVRPP